MEADKNDTRDRTSPSAPSRLPELGVHQPARLHYRPWRGQFRRPVFSILPIARVGLWMMFRRKLFWTIYALALTMFMMFFFGQYLLSWAETQTTESKIRVGLISANPSKIINLLRDSLKLNGSGEMYRNFIWWQGYMVMIVLALAGSVLIGNDFQFGTLPFYLSKPPGRWHYLFGKCLAVGGFVNLMTTLPALLLFVQYAFLCEEGAWAYFTRPCPWLSLSVPVNPLLFGILGYGLVLTACLSLMLVAVAAWLQKTVPLIMVWTTLFFFLRLLASALVDGLQYDSRWRLIDLWNNMYLVGNSCLGIAHDQIKPSPQPEVLEAVLVLGAACLPCLIYLNLRIRAVEIVK